MARVSALDASWTHSWGGVPGTSHWEEAPGKTYDTLLAQENLENPLLSEELEGVCVDWEVWASLLRLSDEAEDDG